MWGRPTGPRSGAKWRPELCQEDGRSSQGLPTLNLSPSSPTRVADDLTSSPKRSQDAEPGDRPGTRVSTGDMLLASGGTVPHNPPQQMNGPKGTHAQRGNCSHTSYAQAATVGIVTFLKCQSIQGLSYFIKIIIIALKVTLFLQLLIQNSSRPPPPATPHHLIFLRGVGG